MLPARLVAEQVPKLMTAPVQLPRAMSDRFELPGPVARIQRLVVRIPGLVVRIPGLELHKPVAEPHTHEEVGSTGIRNSMGMAGSMDGNKPGLRFQYRFSPALGQRSTELP